MSLRTWTSLSFLLICAATQAQQSAPASQPESKKRLTLQAIFGPEGRVDFDGSIARGMRWLEDGESYQQRREGKLMRVDALSDEAEPIAVDEREALEAALAAHADIDETQARRLAARASLWNKDRSALLVSHENRLYFYEREQNRVTRLTREALPRRELALGALGRYALFVRKNDLYSIDTHSKKLRRLTRDGSATTLNGVLDWVYQEEIYGRGRFRAHWIHPQEKYVAYLQLDETPVPEFRIVRNADPLDTGAVDGHLNERPPLEVTNYPKSGDPNPTARLGVVRPNHSHTEWVDLSRYDGIEFLIVDVSWSPDGKLIYTVQDREQTWLDLNEADPRSGKSRVLIRERSPAWTNRIAHPAWLADGSFLWLSERDGYKHLYHYASDGELVGRLTSGAWGIGRFYGTDEARGWVYFSATRDSVIENHAYRVPLAGGAVQRLTEPGATHRVSFDPKFSYFFDTFSDANTPSKVALRRADGSLVRTISENQVAALDEYEIPPAEYLTVEARDGFPLNAMIIRPPNFDPDKKYPVWCYVYGGPGSPTVRNSWSGRRNMFYRYLAQEGYIVWYCDPRSGSNNGTVAHWQAYTRLGSTELRDIEDGIHYLIDNESADPKRIGITGHSYGGYMTSYALTHSEMFSLGIAGAPVTDWHNYDTVYTERYMREPRNNPQGYESSSVWKAAENLHGRLLIAHGLIDDNVHFQNTVYLIDALERAEKMFDLMVYPRDRHGLRNGRRHYQELTIKYILENL